MSQQELLKKVIRALEEAEIQYMITGSVVSSMQGEPRSTHDIDIVIAYQRSVIEFIVETFPPHDFYFEENSIYEAADRRTMFNIIDMNSGDKIDFWILTNETFDLSRFSRRVTEKFLSLEMKVSTPEDTILAKLRWAKLAGGSEKQFTDALRVYEVQFGKLDIDYIKEWAKKLNIELLWKRLEAESESPFES